jgi:hypothetical protein
MSGIRLSAPPNPPQPRPFTATLDPRLPAQAPEEGVLHEKLGPEKRMRSGARPRRSEIESNVGKYRTGRLRACATSCPETSRRRRGRGR